MEDNKGDRKYNPLKQIKFLKQQNKTKIKKGNSKAKQINCIQIYQWVNRAM